MHWIKLSVFYVLLFVIGACKSYKASIYNYPELVDTRDKAIELQKKKEYYVDGIYVDNLFDGARLNHFEKVEEGLYRVSILPENEPINESPWFSFRIRSEEDKLIELIFDYSFSPHRYIPKISSDRVNWHPIDTNFVVKIDSQDIRFPIRLDSVPIYISAQELLTSEDNRQWSDSLALHEHVRLGEYGKSAAGRSLYFLDIYKESKEEKPVVIILSRQHPPEISGYLAMRHFVETLLDNNVLSTNFMNKFRVLVFPMLNPDGVDNGHWRHNMHGIDLNRDWGVYLQPEVKQTVDFIVREVKMNDNQVLLGLDFHSTQEDIFYTYADSLVSVIPGFTENWLFAIDEALPGYELEEEASGITKPYSKVWFYTQFGAESITYEVGDETSRAFVREKARVAAREMMKLLMFYQHE